ncbi:hypothetical protein [Halorubellus sp. PRR65]|uniref:hypothetical protein n=1 Tax=Halorubellus sp. PRR65 TaxID=3098148 RepID=UPI002B258F50|nr:hypothetical protein [Halorubellus sp. PRR65]
MATFEAWTVVDEDDALVLERKAPEKVRDALLDEEWTIYWPDEVNRANVRDPVEVALDAPRKAFYTDEPPEYRYSSVGRREAVRLLSRRGVDTDDIEVSDAWRYPERDEAIVVYDAVDGDGRAHTRLWQATDLSDAEEAILASEYVPSDEDGEDELTREEVAQIVEANSALYPREADIAACWVDGIDDYQRINRLLGDDVTYQSVWQSVNNYTAKAQAVAWEVYHVWPHLPQEQVSDEMAEIVEAVEAESPKDPAFRAEGTGRGGSQK